MLLHQNIQIFFIPLIRVVSVIKLYNEGIRELFYEKFLPIYILIINMNLFECKEGAMVGKFGRVDKRTTTATNLFVDFDLTDFADFMLILSSMALNSLLELVDFEDVIEAFSDEVEILMLSLVSTSENPIVMFGGFSFFPFH